MTKLVRDAISRAGRVGVELEESDFRVVDGDLCIDGMPWLEWVEDMHEVAA